MSPAPIRLVLFDVDGTLLSCGRQIRPLFQAAIEAAYGETADLDGFDFAGKTDDQIVYELLDPSGADRDRIRGGLPRMRREYVRRLDARLERRRMRLLPGVLELLDALDARSGVSLGLLTGNWERGARIKLSRFDLNRYFRFGAFGDGREDRRQLPPVALEAASQALGRRVTKQETLIVGDTSLDVACARANGIRCLAVATGGTSVGALEEAGADWVCQNLRAAGPLAAPIP